MRNAKQCGISGECNVGIGEDLDQQLKRNDGEAAPATGTRTVATCGEVFPDGSVIELIGGERSENPRLLLWDGAKATIGPLVEYGGVKYEPAQFPASVLRELNLPTPSRSHGTTRQLLAEICKLVEDLAGLPAASASLVGRFVLCSWLVEAVPVAPALVLVGPDLMRGNHLATLLHCLCRHALRMTGLTPTGLRSLPSGAGFTLLISQPISGKLEALLDAASRRDQKILHRGGLLNLFGAQIVHADAIPSGECFSHRSVQIPMIPGGAQLPVFDPESQRRITEFQAKLLHFRCTNLSVACKLQFDSSKFAFSIRPLAHAIAVGTPDDAGLQAEVCDLLREKDEEILAERWTASRSVLIAALLVASHDSPGAVLYVSELAAIAQEILEGRGGDGAIDPGAIGKQLKFLGFRTEPRDAKGVKIRMSEDVCRRAQQLSRDFAVPQMESAQRTEHRPE
jgi:hypothetical protein